MPNETPAHVVALETGLRQWMTDAYGAAIPKNNGQLDQTQFVKVVREQLLNDGYLVKFNLTEVQYQAYKTYIDSDIFSDMVQKLSSGVEHYANAKTHEQKNRAKQEFEDGLAPIMEGIKLAPVYGMGAFLVAQPKAWQEYREKMAKLPKESTVHEAGQEEARDVFLDKVAGFQPPTGQTLQPLYPDFPKLREVLESVQNGSNPQFLEMLAVCLDSDGKLEANEVAFLRERCPDHNVQAALLTNQPTMVVRVGAKEFQFAVSK